MGELKRIKPSSIGSGWKGLELSQGLQAFLDEMIDEAVQEDLANLHGEGAEPCVGTEAR